MYSFIDEIDAVGRKEELVEWRVMMKREQTLNQLLVEMDGFGTEETIIVLAATSRPDVLDRALEGLEDLMNRLWLTSPDIKGRKAILSSYKK